MTFEAKPNSFWIDFSIVADDVPHFERLERTMIVLGRFYGAYRLGLIGTSN